MSSIHPILIDNQWRPAKTEESFRATNPKTREQLPDRYPVSGWPDIDAALSAAAIAAVKLRALQNAKPIADFLEGYAGAIEKRVDELATTAD